MAGVLRVGIAHHLGWAVVVVADPQHQVVDRRRIELVAPGLPAAPVHHEGGPHDLHRTGPPLSDEALDDLVTRVRASAVAATEVALDALVESVGPTISSVSLRDWPDDFPTEVSVQRRVPHESRADSIMYRQVLAEGAEARGWLVHRFVAKDVEAEARRILGDRAAAVLDGPRERLGPPWTKDHRIALAATVLAS